MIIQCEHCKTRYEYDESRFERQPSKKIRCARCKEVFQIQNPAFLKKKAAKISSADGTAVRKLPSKPGVSEDEDAPPAQSSGTAPKDDTLQLLKDRRYSVAIIEGPEASTVFRIKTPRVVIGRSNADIVINDSESSREHAVIEIRGSFVLLEDMGSKNGTWMDDERIEGPVELENQTEFRIGGSTLMYIETDE